MDSALPLIKAVITALKAQLSVTNLVSLRIFTDVPQDEEFPYIVVSATSQPFAASDFSGQQHDLRIQAFSRGKSSKEALDIRAAVLDALDRQEENIVLDAGTLVLCQFSSADAFKEDDGKTWQSVAELQAFIQ